MQYPPLPYEAIGRVTVVLIALLTLIAVLLIGYIVGVVLWHRTLTKLTNLCWYGYDITGEHPPDWRREIAIFLNCLKYRDFSNYQCKRKRLSDLEGRDNTE